MNNRTLLFAMIATGTLVANPHLEDAASRLHTLILLDREVEILNDNFNNQCFAHQASFETSYNNIEAILKDVVNPSDMQQLNSLQVYLIARDEAPQPTADDRVLTAKKIDALNTFFASLFSFYRP